MKTKQIEAHLLEVAKLKQRNLDGYFYHENQFQQSLVFSGRKLDDVRLARIDLLMRQLLRYLVLSAEKRQGYDFFTSLPPLFALAETRNGLKLLWVKGMLPFLTAERTRSIGVYRGYKCSPWAHFFCDYACATLLLNSIEAASPTRSWLNKTRDLDDPQPGFSIGELKRSIGEALDKLRPHVAKYKSDMKSLESSVNANYKSLSQQINRFIRAEKQVCVTALKLLYSAEWHRQFKAPEYYFSQVSADIKRLLQSKAHKDLHQKITGFLWKIESADEGLRVHLILFLRPDVVNDPVLFREQIGQRWARDVVADSEGGYATAWFDGAQNVDICPPHDFCAGSSEISQKIDEIVCYVVLQDFFRRYQGDDKVIAKDDVLDKITGAKSSVVLGCDIQQARKRYKHHTYAFGYGQQERRRKVGAVQVRSTKNKDAAA
ncbi:MULTISPECIES: hypothetical protein [Deefgea]|uniref:Inovirus Gp2 family protein n=1 Tax=Deefgea chitinilytica TaxID=570276 RepID=A0ABS2CDR1_9NEIS|nr:MULTISPECIES: hypothetical protein [Deefgea]MBM5572274.1 hypothetical protein [Deefgea chitinilytica]MBM9889510.1 hypothetical protein [Deefgea sp. CFH1-16]